MNKGFRASLTSGYVESAVVVVVHGVEHELLAYGSTRLQHVDAFYGSSADALLSFLFCMSIG